MGLAEVEEGAEDVLEVRGLGEGWGESRKACRARGTADRGLPASPDRRPTNKSGLFSERVPLVEELPQVWAGWRARGS